jgi:signal transduction histidine kinase
VTDPQSTTQTHSTEGKVSFVVTVVVLVVVFLFASAIPWQSSSQVHTLLESVASLLALFAGVLALVRQQTHRDRVFLFIGVGFLGASILDGYHMLVTSNRISTRLPSALPALIPWSWLASRCFLSVCLFLSWLAWKRSGSRPVVSDATIYLSVAAVMLLSTLFLALVPLPLAYRPDFLLHRPAEWIPAIFFGLALGGYVSIGTWRHNAFDRFLICSLMVALASQLVVMPQSKQLFDGMFDLAHLFKIVSYVLVVIGLIVSVWTAFAEVERLDVLSKQTVADLARTNERLAHANEGLEAFVRSASHDLKAPLRHIYGFCNFVRTDAADRLTPNEMTDLQRVMDAATHMSKLLESLLRFAKLGATSLQHETFSLSEVVETIVAQLPKDQQSCVIHTDLSEVTGDKSLLTVVLQNLIENGLKYAEMDPPQVTIRSELSPGETRISVIDNGIGVASQKSTQIFEPGVRAVDDADVAGAGFGLATCARIVTAHQGSIWVESNAERGSTFIFTIPKR